MENSKLHNQEKKKSNRGQFKGFSNLMQEAFVLRICGLHVKQIKEEMNSPSVDAVNGLLKRVNGVYKLDNSYKSYRIAIGKAFKSGFADALFNKYRPKHGKHFVHFENSDPDFPVEDLDEWKNGDKARLDKEKSSRDEGK